jgi:ISXO2-like transposase domain
MRKHSNVNHTRKQYTHYEGGICISMNSLESHFANLKRGLKGVYQPVGKQHLHRYLSEFDFRYNGGELKDQDKSLSTIKGTNGKWLVLRDSCRFENN